MAETTQMLSFHELFFNVDNGYLEGLVRGFRSGVLSQSDYLNLSQCETLEGKGRVVCNKYFQLMTGVRIFLTYQFRFTCLSCGRY